MPPLPPPPKPATPAPVQNIRPVLRVGLIAGLTLALASAAQQFASTNEMRILGTSIIITGLLMTGFFAAREVQALQRNQGSGAGALSGLIAGLFISAAFIATTLLQSLDPENMRVLQTEVQSRITPAQAIQFKEANLDIRSLTQMSVGLAVTCCGLGFPVIGLMLGAMGGSMAVTPDRTP